MPKNQFSNLFSSILFKILVFQYLELDRNFSHKHIKGLIIDIITHIKDLQEDEHIINGNIEEEKAKYWTTSTLPCIRIIIGIHSFNFLI